MGGPGSNVARCASRPAPAPPHTPSAFTLVAVGDFGESAAGRNSEVAAALHGYLEATGTAPDAVLVLGDNFYPDGLIGADTRCAPWVSGVDPAAVRAQLKEVLGPYDFLRGRVPFWVIPGNHDYGCERLGGLANQVDLDRWQPDRPWRGTWQFVSGAPEVLYESPLVQLVALDSEAMIEADASERARAAQQLEDLLGNGKARWRLVAAHHPLASNGEQDGAWFAGAALKALYYPLHLFVFPPFLYGDEYVYEWGYARYRRRLADVFARHSVHLFLAGHDHTLQWLAPSHAGQPPVLISGSAARCGPVRARENTRFAASKNGFAVLRATPLALEVEFVGTTACACDDVCARPSAPGEWSVLYRAAL
ncbi:MAG: metallophosphoesterase [Candidatus Binatia bacterium]